MHTDEPFNFQTSNGETSMVIKVEQKTAGLSLNPMAPLFERDKSLISRYLKNMYKERELDKAATVAKKATLQTEGQRAIRWNIG